MIFASRRTFSFASGRPKKDFIRLILYYALLEFWFIFFSHPKRGSNPEITPPGLLREIGVYLSDVSVSEPAGL